MDDHFLELITARAYESIIENIVNTIKIKTEESKGFIPGNIYFIIYKDLKTLCRRVFNLINSETGQLDLPIRCICRDLNDFRYEEIPHTLNTDNIQIKDRISKMDCEREIVVFICVQRDEDAIYTVLSGIFNINNKLSSTISKKL